MKFYAHWCQQFKDILGRKQMLTGFEPEKCGCCGKDYQEFNLDV